MTLDDFLKSENARLVARGKPKMTDAAFGEMIGLSQAHVNRLRNGKSRPSLDVVVRIAQATRNKVTVNDWHAAPAEQFAGAAQ